ncbi:MAG: TonB-dependent receptor [Muribaculaceae bacterium]|nr:TonB-dependent receptor [Muribaculaceae bacterium]
MKTIRIILLCCITLLTAFTVPAQKVTLHITAPLEKVLSEITARTGYNFNYSDQVIDSGRQVSVNADDKELKDVLKELFGSHDVEFTVKGKTVFLNPSRHADKKADSNTTGRRKVSGTVSDENGDAVIGASVMIAGTKDGVATDLDGNFTLNLPAGKDLVVSSVGYESRTVNVGNRNHLDIVLDEEKSLLDEVVVVGYGTQRKSDITGSVSSVKASELQVAPVASAAEALQGRVAGVVVQNTSGDPSGSASIRIRGSNSLTYGNDPLVIIDGVQDASLGSLNPNQIESMEVLKDAAALSIYGSRGANGVIIVTTKEGRNERAQVTYNGYVTFSKVGKILPSLGASDYASLMNDAQYETGLTPHFNPSDIPYFGQGVNWQKQIFRNAFTQVHNIGISGAKKNVSYYIAGGVNRNEGVIINSDFNEYSLRANMKAEAMPGLTISLNTFASYSLSHKGDTEGALTSALKWSPTKPVYNADGTYSLPGGGVGPVSEFNPVGLAREIVVDNNRTTFNIALQAEYSFTSWLKLSSMLAYRSNSVMAGWFDNQVYNQGPEEDIAGSKTQSSYMALQSTSILNFDKDFGKNHIGATAVFEYITDKYNSTQAASKGIPVGMGYEGVHFGTIIQKPWIESTATKMMSGMIRANYAYDNRYMLSGSFRYDGASQLAPGNKWDGFWAVSGGWNIASENFMEEVRRTVNELKLRLSYGTVGNAAVPAYSSHMKFTPGTDAEGNPTLSISQLSNNRLKWERTSEFNIGLDVRLLSNRITFTAEYYAKKTTDLLMWRTVPSALGVESVLTNVGSVQNRGWEFALGGTPVNAGDFYWNINYSININRNKILALDGLSNTLINSGSVDMPGLVGSYVQMVGQPMGTFLGYRYAGVWKTEEKSLAAVYGAKPGDAKYVDVNCDGVIDKNDVGIIGNAQPKFTYGLNNTFHYRDFDLNIFFQGVYGNDIYNQNRVRRENYTGGDAFPTSPVIADHWTPEHQTDVPAFSGTEYVNSSRWVEDGSYFRLKNITLGYTLPQSWLRRIRFASARLSVSATNLFTLTNYSGYDPEASMGMDAYGAGIDRGVYPSAKSWSIGLDLTF